ncbi:MAG: hypothetical protein KKE37_01900 [Verrucomicrobia bacterium]|nr:hypothetical protein [Verrucomicrobiota bacterium]MBU4289939.1 hypothetical protein [Verrucomicrobiota bacterium]MBU4428089.1 hypothetical protein [Verrucomicrobiota bacterium]MCG2678357.1 hypothetical protein [Kiritimatiellia bacterium]
MAETRREFMRKVAGTLIAVTASSAKCARNGERIPAMEKKDAPRAIRLPAGYYEQFDADYSLKTPAEGYGGWKKAEIDVSPDHTAVVVMHAWDCGTREQYPGWYRSVEYIPRANEICRTVFPKLLSAVRQSGCKLFHVVGGGNYYKQYPGYKRTVELAGPEPKPLEQALSDPAIERLRKFKADLGSHNRADTQRGFKNVDFAQEAKPQGNEGIAENDHQLFALCKEAKVNHLVYAGFAINWCLLLSPGGMAGMQKRGVMCSAIRQAVTAVENKESARDERSKELALWGIAVGFGFVFDVDDFIRALKNE